MSLCEFEITSESPKLFLSQENRLIEHEEPLGEALGNVYIFFYTGYCGSYTEGKLECSIFMLYSVILHSEQN